MCSCSHWIRLVNSGVGLSRILYHLEFCPPLDPVWEQRLAELERVTAKLVGRGLAQDDRQRRFAGLSPELLTGSPSSGGFAVLPLRAHLQARHALWAMRIVTHVSRPWAQLARAMCQRVMCTDLNQTPGPILPLFRMDLADAPQVLRLFILAFGALRPHVLARQLILAQDAGANALLRRRMGPDPPGTGPDPP